MDDVCQGLLQESSGGGGWESGAVVVEFEEGAALFDDLVGCCWGCDARGVQVSLAGLQACFALGQEGGLTQVHWEHLNLREGRVRITFALLYKVNSGDGGIVAASETPRSWTTFRRKRAASISCFKR